MGLLSSSSRVVKPGADVMGKAVLCATSLVLALDILGGDKSRGEKHTRHSPKRR